MNNLYLVFGGVALFLLARGGKPTRKTFPNGEKGAPGQKKPSRRYDDAFKAEAEANLAAYKARQARGGKPAPGQSPTTVAALSRLAIEIQSANSSSLWSDQSKGILHQVAAFLTKGSDGEAQALALLRSLPEDERAPFCKAVATSRAGFSFALGYAWGSWLYLHFGGTNEAGIPVAQSNMGVPQTGKLDAVTLDKIRELTGQEIWPLALKGA